MFCRAWACWLAKCSCVVCVGEMPTSVIPQEWQIIRSTCRNLLVLARFTWFYAVKQAVLDPILAKYNYISAESTRRYMLVSSNHGEEEEEEAAVRGTSSYRSERDALIRQSPEFHSISQPLYSCHELSPVRRSAYSRCRAHSRSGLPSESCLSPATSCSCESDPYLHAL